MKSHPILGAVALLCLAACGNPPQLTPTATPPPAPAPTPLPRATVTLVVHVPAATPPNETLSLHLLDTVGGQSRNLPLTPFGLDWKIEFSATISEVMRYHYTRQRGAEEFQEVTAAQQIVPYRLALVTAGNETLEDTIAAWSDAPYFNDTGHLTGQLRNAATQFGVPGVLVSVGGQLALTDWEGRFNFFNLPAGSQRLTFLPLDGSLKPWQVIAPIRREATAELPVTAPDPNIVHITFMVDMPPGFDPKQPVYLAGNLLQAGDVFSLGLDGASVAVQRQPALTQRDGQWSTTLELPEGSVLNYKYTLGDGQWNGELDGDGHPRLRQYLVPLVNASLRDEVAAWRTGDWGPMRFTLDRPTGLTDRLTIAFRLDGAWSQPVAMWADAKQAWHYTLYNPSDIKGSAHYRYCRNFACGAADAPDTVGPHAIGRVFSIQRWGNDIHDSVPTWNWLKAEPPPPAGPPPILPRPGFRTGIDFADGLEMRDVGLLSATLHTLPDLRVNWVTFTPYSSAGQTQPRPAYADSLSGYLPASDWRALVQEAHAVQINVAFHPVTCPYTPEAECAYWRQIGPNPSAAFWDEWFAAYQAHLLSQAQLADYAGVDQLVIGDFSLRPALPGQPEAPADADNRWRQLIGAVRAKFHRELSFELLLRNGLLLEPAFLDSLDVVRVFWVSSLRAQAGAAQPNLPELINAAEAQMYMNLDPLYGRLHKPIYLSAAYLSASGAASACLTQPDNQCYPLAAFNPGEPDIPRYSLNLTEQADIYSALLQAVALRPAVSGFGSYGYNPRVTLRDKSISVRGKPAEKVLTNWYRALLGP